MQLDINHNLQPSGYSVHILRIDGDTEQVCRDVAAKDAALGFWHYSNNLSAKAGIVQQVRIVDSLDNTLLQWEFGRGYSFDGETYTEKPILMDS